jgi:serine/threonine protein kinase
VWFFSVDSAERARSIDVYILEKGSRTKAGHRQKLIVRPLRQVDNRELRLSRFPLPALGSMMGQTHSNPESVSKPIEAGAPAGSDSAPGTLSPTSTVVPSPTDLPAASTPSPVQPRSQWLWGTLGTYDILDDIGEGGMGLVFKAKNRESGDIVALKTLRFAASQSEEQASRFAREIKAAARLDHPNIVRILDVQLAAGRPYYTMPLMPAGNLARNLSRFRRDPRRTAALVEKIARAVHFAHERGIWHRDLKPQNILLDEHDEPIVTDFGLAKLAESETELTQTGAILGTPAYMAPEQCTGRSGDVGPATDIWALGIILYECLTGNRPFLAGTSEEIRKKVLVGNPLSPREINPAIDPALETIVLKCLKRRPEDRYRSALDLARDLDAWQRAEPLSIRPESALSRSWRGIKRHKWWASATLLACLAVAASATFWFLSPARRFRPLLAALERDHAVQLMGDAGPPLHYRWFERSQGAVTGGAEAGSGQPFRLQSLEQGMMDLLPVIPLPAYRIEAEVVQLSGADPESAAGIFMAGTRDPHQELMLVFSVRDRSAFSAGHSPGALASLSLYKFQGHDTISHSSYPIASRGLDSVQGTWHRLKLELSGQSLRAYCDGNVVADSPCSAIDAHWKAAVSSLRTPPHQQSPDFRASFGLFASHGEVAYRRVKVEAIDSK